MISSRIFLVCLALLLSCVAFGQDFKVPENYVLKDKEDYKPYEKDVLACIDYLENSPLDKDVELRKTANRFLLAWITGCPYIKITVESYVMDLAKKNDDFLLTFLGGWTRYAIENPDDKDPFNGHLAGVNSVLKVYALGKGAKKDKHLDKLIKLQKEDKLEAWLKKELKKK